MSPLSQCILRLAELGRQRRQRLFREWMNSFLGKPDMIQIPDGDGDGNDYGGIEPPPNFGPALLWA